jgi:signal transduction histidine kinase
VNIGRQNSLTPIENQTIPAKGEDLRLRLLRLYLLFAALLLAGILLLVWLVSSRLQAEWTAAEQTLTANLALRLSQSPDLDSFADNLDIWLALAGADESAVVTILGSSGQELYRHPHHTPLPEALAWSAWQWRVQQQAGKLGEGSFISRDPDLNRWLVTVTAVPGTEWQLLLQRPTDVVFAPLQLLRWGALVALLVYLAGGLFSWWVLSRQVIQPIECLESYSGITRWRGDVRPEEQAEMDRLAQRPDQIGALARSLVMMKEETDKRFRELATLLETSRAVASSLDEAQVIDNILDQVQTLFEVERTAVVALDKRAGVFRIRASRGISTSYVQQLRIAPSEPNSPSMRALRNQTPIQVANTETDLAFVNLRPRARTEGFRSVLAIPLKTQYAPPAVLLLYKDAPYRYSYSELELASSFGHHASIAMENAALFALTDERLQEQTRRLEAIVESLSDGLILESTDGRILFCNQQVLRWLHLSRGQARQKSSAALLEHLLTAVDDSDQARELLAAGLSGAGPRTFDLPFSGNGRQWDLRLHLFDVTDANGELIGRGQLWQDVTKDKELDRMKSALLSTVSHELRTPLATIKGYASTLLAEDVAWDEASQREFLQTISQETDRLAALVKNLLDMSRIEAGLLDIRREPYGVNEVVQQAVRGMQPSLNGRLQVELADDLPLVPLDVPRLETAVRNLLENALKYSPPYYPIELHTTFAQNAVTITVRDYGPGVPEDLHDKLFDRFYRVDNSLTRRIGGTGLGLAIAKGFVEAHDGRVWVKSAQPGAIFGITLPAADDYEIRNTQYEYA